MFTQTLKLNLLLVFCLVSIFKINCFGLAVESIFKAKKFLRTSYNATDYAVSTYKVEVGYVTLNKKQFNLTKKRCPTATECLNNVILYCLDIFFRHLGHYTECHIPEPVYYDYMRNDIYREFVKGSEGLSYDFTSDYFSSNAWDFLYPKEYKSCINHLKGAGIRLEDMTDPWDNGVKNLISNGQTANWKIIDFESNNVRIDFLVLEEFIETNKEELKKALKGYFNIFKKLASKQGYREAVLARAYEKEYLLDDINYRVFTLSLLGKET